MLFDILINYLFLWISVFLGYFEISNFLDGL